MCQNRNGLEVEIKGYEYTQLIDECMWPYIFSLRNRGLDTLGCCCGHGWYPMTIVVRKEDGQVYEHFSGRTIPRVRKFYKLDENGYYYIPETL